MAPPPVSQAPYQQPPVPQVAGATSTPVSQEQVDTLVAPIALYPDSLISQILMASTYPLEVVQAQRFIAGNPNQTGDAFASALAEQNWDPSVKSLTNFPSVLQMMNDKLDWTIQLGNAFLAQQQDVMDSVQRLRAQAQAAGNLQTNQQQRVTYVPSDQASTQDISIDSVDPDDVYVPVYDPYLVYGTWRYSGDRPYFWHPHDYVANNGVWWGERYRTGPAWGYAWGRPDWRRHDINIDIHQNENINIHANRDDLVRQDHLQLNNGRGSWNHDPAHRDGIVYGDARVAQRYGGRSPAEDVKAREAYRGRDTTPARIITPTTPQVDRRDDARTAEQQRAADRQTTPQPARQAQPDRAADARANDRGGATNGSGERGGDVQADSDRGRASRGADRAAPSAPSAPARSAESHSSGGGESSGGGAARGSVGGAPSGGGGGKR